LPILLLASKAHADTLSRHPQLEVSQVLDKPISPESLRAAVRNLLALKETKATLPSHWIEAGSGHPSIIFKSEPMRQVMRSIEKARHSKAPVLIRGESGTGKELVARAIAESDLGGGKFVTVNCCALTDTLIESELFGHARGAFSGALQDRPGLFETAEGGTLFLDEIGDFPLRSQAKLLRVLQEGEFRRVGENKLRHAHVRVLAATNRDLESAVAERSFRDDLYYRLNVLPIQLPSLRERSVDIPALLEHFLNKHASTHLPHPQLTEPALQLIIAHPFPGNVRELENLAHRLQHSGLNPVDADFITQTLGSGLPGDNTALLGNEKAKGTFSELSRPENYEALKKTLSDLEKEFLTAQLESNDFVVADAAKAMGITRTALHNRMAKLGIPTRYRKHKALPHPGLAPASEE
jgi:DNA-binding NtrC family response regulator